MTETEIKTLIENQRNFFHTGDTFPVKKRIEKLRKLKTAVCSTRQRLMKH